MGLWTLSITADEEKDRYYLRPYSGNAVFRSPIMAPINSEYVFQPRQLTKEGTLRILILDLKWSYGIEVLTQQLSHHLGARAEVTVLCAKKPEFNEGNRKARQDTYLDSALSLINPAVYTQLLARIRAANPDVIYFISPHVLNVPLLLLCRSLTTAIVISHIHDPEYAGSYAVAVAANLVARLQSRWSHRVYCWGNAIKDTISRKFGVPLERIAVFRHGPGHRTPADVLDTKPATRSPNYFSVIGTIIPRKGVEHYLQAAYLFNERHGGDEVKFLLAGAGDLTPYKNAMACLPNLVVLNRFLEDAEVNELLADSYASVLPYTGGVMQSSFIAIAYGNGCPVVVSNLGSLPEEVESGKTGYVVERANSEQLADAMTKIYTNPEREHMRENCLAAYREKFIWEAIAGQMHRDMVNATCMRERHRFPSREIREDQ